MAEGKSPSFLEGWKFFAALGAMVSVPITVTVWLMSYHEKHPHQDAVEIREYDEFKGDVKEDIRAIKKTQNEISLEMAKQSRAIIEFVNLQEKKDARRRRR